MKCLEIQGRLVREQEVGFGLRWRKKIRIVNDGGLEEALGTVRPRYVLNEVVGPVCLCTMPMCQNLFLSFEEHNVGNDERTIDTEQ